MKDFSLPDVTTYDQTWDDRVVARLVLTAPIVAIYSA
jgi:phage gp37-like protein